MANNGRQLTVDLDSTTLVGVRTKTATINREPVDVSNDDDDGWRRLLATPGTKSVDMSVAGVTEDETLIAEILSGSPFALSTIDINLATGEGATTPGKLSGSFFFTSVEITGEYDGTVEFTAEAQSSGEVTFTATVS